MCKKTIYLSLSVFILMVCSLQTITSLIDDAGTNIDFIYPEEINYSLIPSVNNSVYWDGHAWDTILELDGVQISSWDEVNISTPFTMPPNLVQVDPDESEVVGERYTTIANALTYVATQNPAVSNLWGIKVSGNNSESFNVPAYVRIIGDDTTILSGQVGAVGLDANDYFKYMVHGTTLTNINNAGLLLIDKGIVNGGVNNGVLVINEGSLRGDITGAGQLYVFGGFIFSGDFSTQGEFMGSKVQIQGGTFPINSANNVKVFFVEIGGGTWNGVWARTSRITSSPTFNTGTYKIYGSELIDLTIDDASDDYRLFQCYGGSSGKTITQTAGSLTTEGITNIDISSSGGTWTNQGILYDNRTSGLSSTNTQSAIDEIIAWVTNLFTNYYTKTEVDTNISDAVDSLSNATIARIGNCPVGYVVMNTTTDGVECIEISNGLWTNVSGVATYGNVNVTNNLNIVNNLTTAGHHKIYYEDGIVYDEVF